MNKEKIKTELEQQILSSMISYPDSIPMIYQKVREADFSENNKELFSHLIQVDYSTFDSIGLIIELSKKGLKHWDINLLNGLLLQDNSFERLLFNKVFESFNDLVYSLKVEIFLRKKLHQVKSDFCGLDTLTELYEDVEALLKSNENFKVEQSFSDGLLNILSEIETEIVSESGNVLKTNNFPSFNNSTGGLRGGNLVGICGSYKSGKTTLGLNLVLDFVKQNIPCGFFSLELSETEINRKLLGMLSNISYEVLREPKKLNENEKTRLNKFYQSVKSLPLYLTDKPMSEADIRNKTKYWADRFNVRAVFIDYLGYIRSKKKFESREREVSYYSEYLKSLAKELNITVIVLAQLNRSGKNRPGTENLAESIGLARDCDFLFVTYNPFEIGIKTHGGMNFTESDFIVKLDTTRHTKNKKSFQLRLNDSGNFQEVATEYDNSYSESESRYSLLEDVI